MSSKTGLLVFGLGVAIAASVTTNTPANAQSSVFLSVDADRQTVSGWAVGYNRRLNGCLAAARYTDGTTAWIGYGQNVRAFIAFSNPKWGYLTTRKQYAVVVRASDQRRWRGTFIGFRQGRGKGLINAGLKEDFLEDVARGRNLRVNIGTRRLTSISLNGSRAALKAALDCYKARGIVTSTRPPAPSAGRPPARAGGSSSGTGFFVSNNGHILTNHHVVKGCRSLTVSRVGDVGARAQVVAQDARNDLALLKTGIRAQMVPALQIRARVGESISIYGFPLAGLLATTGNFTVGNITAKAGIGDDTRMMQISAPVQPGNSGGPLLDRYGNVVGVIVSKLNALSVARYTKDLPQNVNFAIKSSIALNFLDSNGVSPPLATATAKQLEGADLADRARQFTVKVACSR